VVVCASTLGQSVTHVKIWGASTPQGPKCSLPNNILLGGSIWASITLLSVDRSSPFFSSNLEGDVVHKILFGFAICWFVQEIFAIKVESFQKSRRILDVFSLSQILVGRPSKTYTHFIIPDSRHVVWKKFYEDIPTSSGVIGAHTMNFKPNFKFSRLKFFGGTPLSVRVCASRAFSICSVCKNFRAQHPLMAEI